MSTELNSPRLILCHTDQHPSFEHTLSSWEAQKAEDESLLLASLCLPTESCDTDFMRKTVLNEPFPGYSDETISVLLLSKL